MITNSDHGDLGHGLSSPLDCGDQSQARKRPSHVFDSFACSRASWGDVLPNCPRHPTMAGKSSSHHLCPQSPGIHRTGREGLRLP